MLDGAVSQHKSEAKPAKANDWRSDWNLFKVSKAKFKISEPLGISRGLNYIEHKPKRYDSRRYEAKLKTKRNEQIFDLTGGKSVSQSVGFGGWWTRHKPKLLIAAVMKRSWKRSGMNKSLIWQAEKTFNSLGFCKLFKLSNFISKVQFQLQHGRTKGFALCVLCKIRYLFICPFLRGFF